MKAALFLGWGSSIGMSMKCLAGTWPAAVNLVTRTELDEEDVSDMSILHECWCYTEQFAAVAMGRGNFPEFVPPPIAQRKREFQIIYHFTLIVISIVSTGD